MEKRGKVDFTALIVEAQVARVVEEEERLVLEDSEVRQLKEETHELLVKMTEAKKRGDEEKRREYRNEVVVKNLRLVTQVLKKYGYFSPDKFQNGCIGLLKAADTFDVEKGVPFHNYAAFCIETEVRLAFRRVNRAFESRAKGYLDSLDAPTVLDNGDDDLDRHQTIGDPDAEQDFDSILEEAAVDTLFYNIIIPCIQQYGTRSKDIDMELWQQLEIEYFIGLSLEHSQRQRLTFTEMARRLGTTPQNIRVRHQKVTALIRKKCEEYGYYVHRTSSGRVVYGKREREYKFKGDRKSKHKKRGGAL